MNERHEIHGSAVAINGRGLLILGESGSGKTSLMLALLARGAVMIGDDRIVLEAHENGIFAKPNPNAEQRLELRGFGIFRAHATTTAFLSLVVNLGSAPAERLGAVKTFQIGSQKIHQYDAKGVPHLADSLYLWLSGRIAPLP